MRIVPDIGLSKFAIAGTRLKVMTGQLLAN
jgi:hypothetical protein